MRGESTFAPVPLPPTSSHHPSSLAGGRCLISPSGVEPPPSQAPRPRGHPTVALRRRRRDDRRQGVSGTIHDARPRRDRRRRRRRRRARRRRRRRDLRRPAPDRIHGGPGEDRLPGGPADDRISGGPVTIASGGNGADRIPAARPGPALRRQAPRPDQGRGPATTRIDGGGEPIACAEDLEATASTPAAARTASAVGSAMTRSTAARAATRSAARPARISIDGGGGSI